MGSQVLSTVYRLPSTVYGRFVWGGGGGGHMVLELSDLWKIIFSGWETGLGRCTSLQSPRAGLYGDVCSWLKVLGPLGPLPHVGVGVGVWVRVCGGGGGGM